MRQAVETTPKERDEATCRINPTSSNLFARSLIKKNCLTQKKFGFTDFARERGSGCRAHILMVRKLFIKMLSQPGALRTIS